MGKQGRPGRGLRRWTIGVTATAALLPVAWVALYRLVPPPVTPLMLLRGADGPDRHYRWVPLAEISHHLANAAIAAEDAQFCRHRGFDRDAIEAARSRNRAGGKLRGGSTISQQTAKNAFLWPDRSWLRKGLEAAFTVLIEALWSKRRILEVYLNIVEWAPGVYGAEAAARHHFGKPASALTAYEAALLAATLPAPRRWSASRPSPYLRQRAELIERRAVETVGLGLTDCAQR